MSIFLFGETIIDINVNLKKKEISSHTKKEKYILENSKSNYGGAGNLYKLLKKNNIFFFTNGKIKKKNIFNISKKNIKKYRYWFKKNIIFQINNFSDKERLILNKNYYKKMFSVIKKTKILLISDHNYGIIKPQVLKKLIEYAQANLIKIYYDSQLRKKISNTYIPRGIDYFLMNRDEFQKYLTFFKLSKSKKYSSLVSLRKKLKVKYLILKLDKHGSICVTKDDIIHKIKPIKNKKSIIGAGDKFLAGLVLKNNEENIKKKLIFCNKFAIS